MAEHEPRDDRRAPRERSSSRKPSSARADRTSNGREGDRKPYAKRDGDRPYGARAGDKRSSGQRDADRKPYVKRDGDRPYQKRDGDRPYQKRDGDRPYQKRDGDRPYQKRDGDRPYQKRDGDRPYQKRDGDRPYQKRDGDRPYQKRDGDRPYQKRDGDRPYQKRDGDRPYQKRDGDRPYQKRDGDRPYQKRDGDRPYARRDGDRRTYDRGARPTRGGADRPDRAVREGEIRPVRPRHTDPVIPEDVTAKDLPASARNELKTLSKENADQVARHLAMAAQLIDEDPELAHQHALSASRRAGRIAVVRETLGITAYATGDFSLALRELRTYRRISGRDDQIALIVDSERGVGRPDRALEVGRSVDRTTLDTPVRVELAIAMSGARLDLGETERALQELDIPELDPDRAFAWSPALFAARASVLEELGRLDEADQWRRRAVVAGEALDAASGLGDLETVYVEEVLEEPDEVTDSEEVTEPEEVAETDEPAASVQPEPEEPTARVEPAAEQEEIAGTDGEESSEQNVGQAPTIADEVAEILIEAGVDEPEAPGRSSNGGAKGGESEDED